MAKGDFDDVEGDLQVPDHIRDHILTRGAIAEQFMMHPAYKSVVDELMKHYQNVIAQSQPSQQAEREHAYWAMQAVREIEAELKKRIGEAIQLSEFLAEQQQEEE